MKDTFNINFNVISDESANFINEIKSKCKDLEMLFLIIKNREMSIAHTKLEECCMWAVKSICAYDLDMKEEK